MDRIWDSYEEEAVYWFWLVNIPGVGRKLQSYLLERFHTPQELFRAKEEEVSEILKPKALESFCNSRDKNKICNQYNDLRERGITFLWSEHEEYPKRLKHLYDYPYGIYCKGMLPPPQKPSIAIVGARNASLYGKEMAMYMAKELAKRGFSVISGLARGIDECAHVGALKENGYTLGILGCGINICYPKENYDIFRRMEREGGIMSEYPLNTSPHAGLFPMRNRLIAAMADGILVVEAKAKSGSLITVDQGLELGRDIFALPGKPFDELCKGCNDLIKSGAKMVTDVEDIVEEYQNNYVFSENFQTENKNPLVKKEKMVYSVLRLEPKYIDTIIEETQLPVSEVMTLLMSLEMKGYIKQAKRNYYSVNL